jgi:hypothetical protein
MIPTVAPGRWFVPAASTTTPAATTAAATCSGEPATSWIVARRQQALRPILRHLGAGRRVVLRSEAGQKGRGGLKGDRLVQFNRVDGKLATGKLQLSQHLFPSHLRPLQPRGKYTRARVRFGVIQSRNLAVNILVETVARRIRAFHEV